MQLKTIQRRFPEADSAGGKVVVFHEGKHYELGTYVGEGSVVLTQDGHRLLADLEVSEPAPARAGKASKLVQEVRGLDLNSVKE